MSMARSIGDKVGSLVISYSSSKPSIRQIICFRDSLRVARRSNPAPATFGEMPEDHAIVSNQISVQSRSVRFSVRRLRRYARDRKSTRLNLQSLMRISYAVFCLKKKQKKTSIHTVHNSRKLITK